MKRHFEEEFFFCTNQSKLGISIMTTNESTPSSTSKTKVVVPGFISKTFEIFSDSKQYDQICRWNSNGTAIEIVKLDDFVNTILPQYFKHKNFPSFVRQLNMYGFRKTMTDSNNREFKHDLFQRDHPELLCEIKRKSTTVHQASASELSSSAKLATEDKEVDERDESLKYYKEHRELSDNILAEMKELRRRNEQVESKLHAMKQQNAIIHLDNQRLWDQLKTSKNVQQSLKMKMQQILMFIYQIFLRNKSKIGGKGSPATIVDLSENDNIDTESMTVSKALDGAGSSDLKQLGQLVRKCQTNAFANDGTLGAQGFYDCLKYLAIEDLPGILDSSEAALAPAPTTTLISPPPAKRRRQSLDPNDSSFDIDLPLDTAPAGSIRSDSFTADANHHGDDSLLHSDDCVDKIALDQEMLHEDEEATLRKLGDFENQIKVSYDDYDSSELASLLQNTADLDLFLDAIVPSRNDSAEAKE